MAKTVRLPASLNDPKFRRDKWAYYYGGRKLKAMTQWLKQFQKPFDGEYWAKKKAEERGITPEEVQAEWSVKGDRSRALGIAVHEAIETYLNGSAVPMTNLEDEPLKRFLQFRNLMETRLKGAVAVAQELPVFSARYGIAGALDTLLMTKENQLFIGDWKTNEKFSSGDEGYGNLLAPFEHLKDNHLNAYGIQTALLRVLLEDHGLEVQGSFIVHLPPEAPEAIVHFPPDLRPQVRDFLEATAPKVERNPF